VAVDELLQYIALHEGRRIVDEAAKSLGLDLPHFSADLGRLRHVHLHLDLERGAKADKTARGPSPEVF